MCFPVCNRLVTIFSDFHIFKNRVNIFLNFLYYERGVIDLRIFFLGGGRRGLKNWAQMDNFSKICFGD